MAVIIQVSLFYWLCFHFVFLCHVYYVPTIHHITYLVTFACASFSCVESLSKYVLFCCGMYQLLFLQMYPNCKSFISGRLHMNLGGGHKPLEMALKLLCVRTKTTHFCTYIFGWMIMFHQGFRNGSEPLQFQYSVTQNCLSRTINLKSLWMATDSNRCSNLFPRKLMPHPLLSLPSILFGVWGRWGNSLVHYHVPTIFVFHQVPPYRGGAPPCIP